MGAGCFTAKVSDAYIDNMKNDSSRTDVERCSPVEEERILSFSVCEDSVVETGMEMEMEMPVVPLPPTKIQIRASRIRSAGKSIHVGFGIHEKTNQRLLSVISRIIKAHGAIEPISLVSHPSMSREASNLHFDDTLNSDDFKGEFRIGGGAFADVYRTTRISDGKALAKKKSKIRIFMKPKDKDIFIDTFRKEVELVSKLNHPNIVKFYGCIVEFPTFSIICELMVGSVLDLIHIVRCDKDTALKILDKNRQTLYTCFFLKSFKDKISISIE